ncbi:MAG: hypothetical protein M3321_04145 [Actinomycetota bacterium]|nr:hypothetical protein [Actinomycetota bacterium]
MPLVFWLGVAVNAVLFVVAVRVLTDVVETERLNVGRLTAAEANESVTQMFSEVRKHGPFDKKTRKEKAREIEQAVRPVLDDSAGTHVFGVADEDDVLTGVTVYERRAAAEASASRAAEASAEGSLAPPEVRVTKLARPAKPKPRATRRGKRGS